ncbi:hypothetical protein Bhyg_07869 [Pseudolycoriella hygida]|uniref:Uncharacterized protein n=1 Tax=Pseudolycoriella hygida TaxID=35572 RepID=A0A9Q0S3S4_9DIPT|nr:hypothetical protein Bhyg_07869 [Pseudolycoriella hygida]
MIQRTAQETEFVRKQVEHFKGLNVNLTSENSRLCHDISELTCACNELKKKQELSDVEVIRLKDSIKDYIFKIKEVEDTLTLKNTECDRILDHFNTFENGTKDLERANHRLELENEQANALVLLERYQLIVKIEWKRRDKETQLQQANSEAIKELCSKLDIEKEKLKEELKECANIRRKPKRDGAYFRGRQFDLSE